MNKPGKGPQVSFLKSEEFYMSPAYFAHMEKVQKGWLQRQQAGEGELMDYESSFKLG